MRRSPAAATAARKVTHPGTEVAVSDVGNALGVPAFALFVVLLSLLIASVSSSVLPTAVTRPAQPLHQVPEGRRGRGRRRVVRLLLVLALLLHVRLVRRRFLVLAVVFWCWLVLRRAVLLNVAVGLLFGVADGSWLDVRRFLRVPLWLLVAVDFVVDVFVGVFVLVVVLVLMFVQVRPGSNNYDD